MKRVIITGSPRANGRSAHVAEMLFEAHIDERPKDELFLVPISEIEVGPCIGCNACRKPTEVTFTDDDGVEHTELRPRCVFDDDMQTVYDLLDDADELTIVSPIYFSGAPAPLKCLIDRMQPYFWDNFAPRDKAEGGKGAASQPDADKAADLVWVPRPKRPLTLHVLGEGGDPHGFDPLISEVKSSLACAGFRLLTVYDWVGKVTAQGEITAEADVREIATLDDAPSKPSAGKAAGEKAQREAKPAKKQRPKLDLSKGKKGQARGK